MCDKSWNEIEEEEQKYLDLVYEVSQLRNELDLAESLYKLAIRERDYERTLCDFYKKEAMDLEMSYEKILQSKTELLKEENDLSKVEIHEISKFKIGDLVKLATGLGDPVDGVWKVKKNTVGLVTEVEFVGDSFTLYTVDFGQEEQYRCIISDVSEECLELFSKGAEPMPNKNEEIHEKEEHGYCTREATPSDIEIDIYVKTMWETMAQSIAKDFSEEGVIAEFSLWSDIPVHEQDSLLDVLKDLVYNNVNMKGEIKSRD